MGRHSAHIGGCGRVVSANKLRGTVPDKLSKLTDLVELYGLFRSSLCGSNAAGYHGLLRLYSKAAKL